MQIRETEEYAKWFRHLRDSVAKARISARLRLIGAAGRLVGDYKPVGDKVVELRFDIGPGYRVGLPSVCNRAKRRAVVSSDWWG